ncbi:unnamed protein product [Citrullus colocynthis]|uniref:Uncharacterized protein n=1 Tax=Citrullus colocynthis TaxID=252529 RepID=A0ABP0Z6P7_9ROSI
MLTTTNNVIQKMGAIKKLFYKIIKIRLVVEFLPSSPILTDCWGQFSLWNSLCSSTVAKNRSLVNGVRRASIGYDSCNGV